VRPERVVDEVGEDPLDREAVGGDGRQRTVDRRRGDGDPVRRGV
jgi:hypothetical protein